MRLQCPEFDCGTFRDFSQVELDLYLETDPLPAKGGSVISIDWRCPACGTLHASRFLPHELLEAAFKGRHAGYARQAQSFLDIIYA